MIAIQILCWIFPSFTADDIFAVKSFKTLRSEDVVRQTHEESCGASSLATLFNLYGYSFAEKDLIDDLNTTDVVNFNQLIIARVVRNKEYPHFVVIKRHEGDFITVLDPNYGKFVVGKDEFFSNWLVKNRGYILVVLPKEKRNFKELDIIFNKSLYNQF